MTDADISLEEEMPNHAWDGADVDDVGRIDLDAPIAGIGSADCRQFEDAYRKASEEAQDPRGARVLALVAALCGFHFRPNEKNAPFGPMLVMGSKRSPIPDDFRALADVIAVASERVTVAPLRARLADVAWMLNRRRVDLGRSAIAAYTQTLSDLILGEASFRRSSVTVASASACNLLERALVLASFRTVGKDTSEQFALFEVARQIAGFAVRDAEAHAVERVLGLCLAYAVSEPTEIASMLEAWLARNSNCDGGGKARIMRLAAAAHRQSGALEESYRCTRDCSEVLATMGDRAASSSAMMAASYVAEAIAELHGVPNSRDQRKLLKHRLVDIQADIPDEMGSITKELDLEKIIKSTEAKLGDLNLRDILFVFAALERSPDPEELQRRAIKSLEDSPLVGTMSATFVDRDGKAVYRSPGLGADDDPQGEVLRPIISRIEAIRRNIFVSGQVHTVRRIINENYYIGDDTLAVLLSRSGFVEPDLLHTYCRGFTRFFQGDMVSALFLLAPLLEASLRHVLRGNGNDVTSFDNATKTQQELTITALFDQMRPELDEIFGTAITTDLDNVFLSKPGPCIRHEVAHGLLSDGVPYGADAVYACWLIFRLCLYPLFAHREEFLPDLI